MFVGRYEISISVTVEHVQHVGIIIVFLPGERVEIFSSWRDRKNCWDVVW